MKTRQYIITNKLNLDINFLTKQIINTDLNIYYDHNLEFSYVEEFNKGIYLLGFVFDPFNIERTSEEILNDFIKCNDKTAILKKREKLSGHYILVVSLLNETFIFADFFSEMQIFYYKCNNEIFVSSSDKLILDISSKSLNLNSYKKSLINDKDFLHKNEHYFLGYEDWDEDIKKLLPDNTLSLKTLEVNRIDCFNIKTLDVEEIIELYKVIILNSLDFYKIKFDKIMIGLTAGIDSRLLLAISRLRNFGFNYFTFSRENEKSKVDTTIAMKIANKLRLNYNSYFLPELDKQFIFPRILSKTRNIQWYKINLTHKDVVLTSYGSDFIRGYHDNEPFNNEISILKTIKYDINKYNQEKTKEWLNSNIQKYLEKESNSFLKISDLHHLEIRYGKHGSKGSHEHNFANINMISPFNNKYLQYSVLKSIDINSRKHPENKFHKIIINSLLPELENIPYNPYNKNIKEKIAEKMFPFYKLYLSLKKKF
ncbi:hypothetical protein MSHRCOH1_08715 [Candidatus Ornithobacterium hominis]|uniref:hypothetical protein n=1 Tax=Candidatus Ornithobacterium hominis TaxID=2497989 RepID=UPI0024BD3632|nr:hypothetical protein [Candidatus Ornithobacterium hominis]CAI9430270.1 hypothetical protein MSHRCOH1_08715 [Candidatus Ornithobacterium hominis]